MTVAIAGSPACDVSVLYARGKTPTPLAGLCCCPGREGGDVSRRMEERVVCELNAAEREESCLAAEDRALRRALRRRGDELVEPLAGVFARRATWRGLDPVERTLWLMRAASRLHPGWRFCGASAAVAHGLPVSWGLLTSVFVDAPRVSAERGEAGVLWRHLDDAEACVSRDLPVTSLWRTVFDCLATFPAADALAVVDAAARMSGASARQVVDYLRAEHRGRRGVRRAVELAALADGRAESGGESIARHTMHELGLEQPELQVWIEDPVRPGNWFRVDFLWLLPGGAIVIGELDGRRKSERPELMGGRSAVRVLQDERLRESHLTALRPAIARFGYDDARDPARLGSLLEGYGVPRRASGPELPPATRKVRAELVRLDGWTLLVTDEVPA